MPAKIRVDHRRAINLYNRELTFSEIAKEMGISPSPVCKWASEHGLSPNRRDRTGSFWALYIHGLGDKEIADRLDTTTGAVITWRNKRGLAPHIKTKQPPVKHEVLPPVEPRPRREITAVDLFMTKLQGFVEGARGEGVEPPPDAVARFMAEWHKQSGGTDYERVEASDG